MGKKKRIKTDGLGPYEIQKIRAAIRLVWHRSYARSIVVKRCVGKDGFSYCENKKCGKRAPKIFIDHIVRVGDLNGGFIKRLFTPLKNLQGLCKKCHDAKTKEERAFQKAKEREKDIIAGGF